MAGNTIVRASVDEDIKNEAAAVLAEIGLTVSDAVRLLLICIANEKSLTFDPLIPNAETVAAMDDARDGRNVRRFKNVDDLFEDLNAVD